MNINRPRACCGNPLHLLECGIYEPASTTCNLGCCCKCDIERLDFGRYWTRCSWRPEPGTTGLKSVALQARFWRHLVPGAPIKLQGTRCRQDRTWKTTLLNPIATNPALQLQQIQHWPKPNLSMSHPQEHPKLVAAEAGSYLSHSRGWRWIPATNGWPIETPN